MAVPTTLSGAEMTVVHRHVARRRAAGPPARAGGGGDQRSRAVSLPAGATNLAASALNALGHAAEGPCYRARPTRSRRWPRGAPQRLIDQASFAPGATKNEPTRRAGTGGAAGRLLDRPKGLRPPSRDEPDARPRRGRRPWARQRGDAAAHPWGVAQRFPKSVATRSCARRSRAAGRPRRRPAPARDRGHEEALDAAPTRPRARRARMTPPRAERTSSALYEAPADARPADRPDGRRRGPRRLRGGPPGRTQRGARGPPGPSSIASGTRGHRRPRPRRRRLGLRRDGRRERPARRGAGPGARDRGGPARGAARPLAPVEPARGHWAAPHEPTRSRSPSRRSSSRCSPPTPRCAATSASSAARLLAWRERKAFASTEGAACTRSA